MAKAETKTAAAPAEAAKAGAAEAADIKGMSFEAALTELEAIVSRLERGDVPLEQSVAIYERGEALKAHCARLLQAAEDKIEKIRLDDEGKPQGTEPLD